MFAQPFRLFVTTVLLPALYSEIFILLITDICFPPKRDRLAVRFTQNAEVDQFFLYICYAYMVADIILKS